MNFLNYVTEKLKLSGITITTINIPNKTTRKNEISLSGKNAPLSFIILEFILCPWLSIAIFEKAQDMLISLALAIVIVTINILLAIHTRNKIFKTTEPQVKNLNIYRRDLPSNLTPAHVKVLLEDGNIDSYTLASTILDLADKNYLKIESHNKEDLFTKNITLSLTDKPQDNLFTYEKYLINWFFDKPQITSEDLKKRLNNPKENPAEKFSIFEGLILLSFPLDNYYKPYKGKNKKSLYSLFIILYFLLLFFFSHSNSYLIYIIATFIMSYGLSFILITNITYTLNDKGTELKDEYLDLKKYLEDFSLIDKKTSEMISLWDFYLSYSVALGIKGIASKEIKNFFGNEIYNLNNVDKDLNVINTEESQKYITEIDNIINHDKQLYQNKNIWKEVPPWLE